MVFNYKLSYLIQKAYCNGSSFNCWGKYGSFTHQVIIEHMDMQVANAEWMHLKTSDKNLNYREQFL